MFWSTGRRRTSVPRVRRCPRGECRPSKQAISKLANRQSANLQTRNQLICNQLSAYCWMLSLQTSNQLICKQRDHLVSSIWQSTWIENWVTWACWAATIFPGVCKLWNVWKKESHLKANFTSSPILPSEDFCVLSKLVVAKTRRYALFKTRQL